MPTPKPKRLLSDTYAFPGFRPEPMVRGVFGDPKARVIALKRRSKKRPAAGGGRRSAAIKDVARELKLDWHAVKALEKQYMAAQLAKAGRPGPKAIGIDEISIRKGHTYRIVGSDLLRGRPIWFGGQDRSEASMALFYDWLGEEKTRGSRWAVMDMWKPFYNATVAQAPQAAILYDKFHIMRHLGEALDEVRKSEYRGLRGRG